MEKKISLNEKILIAGAKGMVGRATHAKLLEKGYGNKFCDGKIFCPDRHELDLANYSNVESWFNLNRPTTVILAAAKVGGIIANNTMPAEFILENLKIQTNVIENSFKYKVKRFLFLGSSCIYPKYAKQPIKEEYLLSGKLEETNQWYAVAKIAGLKLCESLRIQYGFDAISLMPTNLYGPFDNYHPIHSHVLPAFIRRFDKAIKKKENVLECWGDGSPLREFLYVEDLADAIVFLLEKYSPSISEIKKNNTPLHLNVGSGEEISILELSQKVAKFTGFKGEVKWNKDKPNGTPRKKIDSTRISNLGWRPKTFLDKGIPMAIEAYRKENYK